MKRNLLALVAVGAIALGGFAVALAENGRLGGRCHGGHGLPLAHLTKSLNLTPDQEGKVQPLVDQAGPQIIAIHKDAMEKTHAIIDKTMSQIRPILTPDQQKKFDDLQRARQDMRNSTKKLHEATKK